MPTGRPRKTSPLRPFLLWLGLVYAAWLALVVLGGHWATVREHWEIAATMAAGSYVAGSTPMGGGTVGFPVLVLFFDSPATLGRDFSFCIQAIGMVSASILIVCRGQPLERQMLRYAALGSLVGTPLGILVIAPLCPPLFIKVLFTVLWASFGVLHLRATNRIAGYHGITPAAHQFDRASGLAVGFVGGATVAAITGVGIDMMIYAVLVLMCHADLKVAIPTSVLLMAFTSVVGVATKSVTTGFEPGVFEHWLAAAPVVLVGAPFGALIVDRIGRKPTLYVVSVLCILQFFWTLTKESDALGPIGIVAACLAVVAFLAGFHRLDTIGRRLARRSG